MGITIWYQAKSDKENVDKNTKYWLKTIPKIAETAPEVLKPEIFTLNKKERKKLVKDWNEGWRAEQHGKVEDCDGTGINIPGCETLSFIFCKKIDDKWVLDNFTKTQFCGVPGHLMTCRMLEEARRRYFPNMKIDDEGDFCGDDDDHDIEKLKESLTENALLIDKVTGMLEETWGENHVKSGAKLKGVI